LLCPSLDALHVLLGGRIVTRTEFFYQHLGESADVPQRRPQVMRHRVAESFQFFVGSRQLGRPLHHPMLELFIEFSDFSLVCFLLRNVTENGRPRTGCPERPSWAAR